MSRGTLPQDSRPSRRWIAAVAMSLATLATVATGAGALTTSVVQAADGEGTTSRGWVLVNAQTVPDPSGLRSYRVMESPTGDRMWISTLDRQAQRRFDQMAGQAREIFVCGRMRVDPDAEWGWNYDPGEGQLRTLLELPEDGLWKTIRQLQNDPITAPDTAACIRIDGVAEALDGPPPKPTDSDNPGPPRRAYLPILLLNRERPSAPPTTPPSLPTTGPPLPTATATTTTIPPTPTSPAAKPPLPLGTVRVRDEGCRDFRSQLADTRCVKLEVTCPSAGRITVNVAISEPIGDGPPRGTIVLGTGSGGQGWYEDFGPTAVAAMNDLRAAGFRVVQRAWIGAWEAGEAGMAANACRYATLVAWVDETLRAADPQSALCVSGNSGGAAEIGYALARFGSEAHIDFAVPSGGPPMSRIDRHCAGDLDPEWQRACPALIPPESSCARWDCAYLENSKGIIDAAYADTPCADRDLERLRSDSILSPDADLDYPETPVHFVIGDDDCTAGPPQALIYLQSIQSETTLTWALDTQHSTPRYEGGALAIRDALLAGCTRRR